MPLSNLINVICFLLDSSPPVRIQDGLSYAAEHAIFALAYAKC